MVNGDIYTWEASSDKGYSIGLSLKTLIENGLPNHHPPKSLDELLEQMLKLINESSNEWGGSITFNSFDNHITPFLESEKPSKQRFIDQIENFNKGIDAEKEVLITLDLIPRVGFPSSGKTQVILDAANGVILDTYRSRMEKGLFEPYFKVNLYSETDWNSQTLSKCFELSYKFGQPTYQNFITGTISPETLRPREFNPNSEVMYLRLGGVLGNSDNQSVIGYTCINLENISLEAKNEEEFYQYLDEKVAAAVSTLMKKREKVEAKFNSGKMPITRHFLDDMNWSFSVISILGMNEALENLIDAPIGHVAGKAVAYKVIEYLLRKLEIVQIDTGKLFSLEAYPSEMPSAILMDEYDSEHICLTPATDLKSSHGDDLWDVLEHQKRYHSMYTGGTLMQIHLAKGLNYNNELKLLIQRTIDTFGYNYLAITPVFSLCPDHGYVSGKQKCPECGNKTETFTRIDNKTIPISSLPEQLKEAYRRRVYYDVKNQ